MRARPGEFGKSGPRPSAPARFQNEDGLKLRYGESTLTTLRSMRSAINVELPANG